MPFHIPFNQRASRRQQLGPIYIGFDPVAPPRQKFNWWGFHGLWLSFASLLTAGFTSFIPLVISLIGLRRPGKKMATVGTVISLIGLTLAGTIVTTGVAHVRARKMRHERAIMQRTIHQQVAETNQLLEKAKEDLIEYRGAHDGFLPNDLDGNLLVVGYVDPWGESLRFEPTENNGVIRSAGPDKEFLTGDDVKQTVSGKSEKSTAEWL